MRQVQEKHQNKGVYIPFEEKSTCFNAIRHKSLQNIPEIWRYPQQLVLLWRQNENNKDKQ